jgi:hypothetical protein
MWLTHREFIWIQNIETRQCDQSQQECTPSGGGGAAALLPPHQPKKKFRNTDFVDKISDILHDLPFSQNQLLKFFDDCQQCYITVIIMTWLS